MPANPQLPINPLSYRALDIILDAMIEVGIIAPGDEDNADPSVVQWVFRKANYLLDEWASQNTFVYAEQFLVFTLVANHDPHTIGPGTAQTPADFSVAQRPVKMLSPGCAVLFPGTNGTHVDVPIQVEDDDWWGSNPVKDLPISFPTHLYYSPDNVNGSLYFWPVPTIAYQVRLRMWTLLSQFAAVTDPVDGPGGQGLLPPAYRQAIMLTLAEQIGGKPPENLPARALKARMAIMGPNQGPPRIDTESGGMPSARARQRYNFLTREPW